jgi:hypothetical protein
MKMAAQIALVATTIGDGAFLTDYAQSIISEARQEQVRIIVIPDRKSPADLFRKAEEIARLGIRIDCPTLIQQDEYLAKFGNLRRIIPYDSDNRRNIGYLLALEGECELLISIDDDNFPQSGSQFFGEHLVVNSRIKLEEVSSSTGWYNICQLLQVEPMMVFPRGYPYCQRREESIVRVRPASGLVHMNAGLWLRHPDVDAITLLGVGPKATGFGGRSVLLGRDTWTPINTQNTAISRCAIPAFYFLKMGYPAMGMPIDRDGDIFCGYFAQACIRHLGYNIRVGTPLTDHRRNSHNYLKDLTYELGCICMLEEITAWLHELKLEGNNYFETYACLAEKLDEQAERFTGMVWNDVTRGYLHYITYCMRTWLKAVAMIGIPERELVANRSARSADLL